MSPLASVAPAVL